MGLYFGYMRISTKEEREQQRFSRQEKGLNDYAKRNNIDFVRIYQEDISGASFSNRTEWKRLEEKLSNGDTVVFKDISRFTREAENGLAKYMMLMNKGVELIFLDNQAVSTPYIKQMLAVAENQNLVLKTTLESIVKILLIVELDRVEQERKIVSQRTKDGLAASKKHPGRTAGSVDKLTPKMVEDIRNYLSDRDIKKVDLIKKYKISPNTMTKYIRLVKLAGPNSIETVLPKKKED